MDETAVPAAAAPRSIGERLRAGRERAGLSVAAAAEKLHLDPKVIESLEANKFSELGASVYVRGHLRRYADFVGEPGAELVDSYVASRESRPPPPDLTKIPHAEHHSDPRRLLTPLLGLACVAVLLLAIWWVLSGSKGGARPPAQNTEVAADQPAPVVQPGVAVPANAEPATAGPDAPLAASAANGAPAPASATTAPPARREETAPARETRLKLELTNDSWVEVYDARGERLFYDVASAGSVQSVTGRGPLRVVLGNAAGVTVEVDGQAREIPGNAADGEGARFVVNRSGSLSRAR